MWASSFEKSSPAGRPLLLRQARSGSRSGCTVRQLSHQQCMICFFFLSSFLLHLHNAAGPGPKMPKTMDPIYTACLDSLFSDIGLLFLAFFAGAGRPLNCACKKQGCSSRRFWLALAIDAARDRQSPSTERTTAWDVLVSGMNPFMLYIPVLAWV